VGEIEGLMATTPRYEGIRDLLPSDLSTSEVVSAEDPV
jgi:hypothetical protein